MLAWLIVCIYGRNILRISLSIALSVAGSNSAAPMTAKINTVDRYLRHVRDARERDLLSFGSLLVPGRLTLVDMRKVAKIAKALSVPIEDLIK